jgi:hypothetical protein
VGGTSAAGAGAGGGAAAAAAAGVGVGVGPGAKSAAGFDDLDDVAARRAAGSATAGLGSISRGDASRLLGDIDFFSSPAFLLNQLIGGARGGGESHWAMKSGGTTKNTGDLCVRAESPPKRAFPTSESVPLCLLDQEEKEFVST